MEAKKKYIRPEILVEEWKVYKESGGYKSIKRIYEVSNLGRVKINGKIFKFNKNQRYYNVGKFYVHRAVAELFIPNPENKPYIDHIDTNKHNNVAWNLQWVTQKENMNNPLTQQYMCETMKIAQNRPETRQKHSEAMKDRIYINKNDINKKVKTNQLSLFLNNGWNLGRK